MTLKPLLGLVALATVGLAACGGGSDDATSAPAPAPAESPAPAPASSPVAPVAVKVADTEAGEILIGPDGKTLYGFTNDVAATSTCYSTCAQAWPPVLVGGEWAVGPGLDSGVFSTVAREDGTTQLVAGKFPLYEYSGDAAPGDTNGQGSGDVWFIVGTDAKLVKPAASAGGAASSAPATTAAAAPPTTAAPAAAPASAKLADSPLGKILVDADGRTLYGFTNDKDGTSTCTGNCAKAWPAATITGQPAPGDSVTAQLTAIDAPAGGKMLKAGKWPLYRFSGDAAPGETNGQGSGGVWFVVGADGKLIKA
jgi:predicted lipoprotein with Yx(FWY)xxD motif